MQLSIADSAEKFLLGLGEFQDFGRATEFLVEGEIPYYVNEFWTAGQRRSHSIHEISYRACFKAQLPEFFISRLTRVGATVFDPFMGRGTTLVQAALMNRCAFGHDITPLSVLLTRPRLAPMTVRPVSDALRTVTRLMG